MRYFDTGVLLKLYLREPNSAQAVALVQEKGERPPLTALHRLEMKAALGQKLSRGEITEAERRCAIHGQSNGSPSSRSSDRSRKFISLLKRNKNTVVRPTSVTPRMCGPSLRKCSSQRS